MLYTFIKTIVTALLIVGISELSKRSSLLGAILASIPLVSVLAMVWLYIDTKDVEKISALSTSVFCLVIPSLALFISLPLFIKQGWNFYLSLTLSSVVTVAAYGIMVFVLHKFGIKL